MLQEGIVDRNIKFTPVLDGYRMPEYIDWELQPFSNHKVFRHPSACFWYVLIICICLWGVYLQQNGCWAQNAEGTSLVSVALKHCNMLQSIEAHSLLCLPRHFCTRTNTHSFKAIPCTCFIALNSVKGLLAYVSKTRHISAVLAGQMYCPRLAQVSTLLTHFYFQTVSHLIGRLVFNACSSNNAHDMHASCQVGLQGRPVLLLS